MPEELDPNWEYWTPEDQEIAEILHEASQGINMMERVLDGKVFGDKDTGLRFGWGRVDGFIGRLAREKPERVREPKNPSIVHCVGCGGAFHPEKRGRLYCSEGCRPVNGGSREGAGRIGILPENAEQFREMWEGGITRREISKILGIANQTISNWVKRLGLQARATGHPKGVKSATS